MEYKVDDIISYNDEGKTIYLKVTPTRDATCKGCYFHGHKCHCSAIKNIVGECGYSKRTDKQLVIFTKVNDNIMEYKIGDTFCLEDGTKLEVVKATCNCKGCYFFNDKDDRCSRTKDIVCSAPRRTDKEFVIFKQLKNNNIMKKKMTIDIYVVMQVHKTHRSFCGVFTSFKEANTRFETLLKNFEKIYKVQPKKWTIECLPSQIKVFIIGDITLYLYKETKEVEIEETIPEPVFDEPKFRSFFSSYNCFSESVKHVPFGVLVNEENIYFTILNINTYGISVVDDKGKIDVISFKDASKLFNYADGSPFGYII